MKVKWVHNQYINKEEETPIEGDFNPYGEKGEHAV